MRRIATLTFVVLLVTVGTVAAEEVKGKIKKLDVDKGMLFLEDDKSVYRLSAATEALNDKGKSLGDGLSDKALSVGAAVTVTFELKGKNKIAKKIQLEKADKK